ncbi:MAG: protein kinase domain-containing protein [Isosphaeraceae bacterium]
MTAPSQVEAIFFAALEEKITAERADYLDRACGEDAELRRRVERLLEAFPQALSFLARPAVELADIASRNTVGDTEGFSRASDKGSTNGAPAGRPWTVETLADDRGDEEDNVLEILQPSEKPGSLGRLAHYECLEVLGKGSFGTVVKAFDERLQRTVAIKLMSPTLAATSAPRKRFLREARSAASVRHQNVIAIHDVEDRPIPYLVMDYIAGQTLQEKLDATGPPDLMEVLRIGQQIACGLAAAHAMGLIHRDIKPSYIMLESGVDHVKITDFGLARAVDDASITQSGLIAGTPMYMAPEQALGESIDQRADLFSLGSVLYVMCSGRPPFRAANTIAVLKRVAEDTPRPIREIVPEIPEWLCDLIARLQAKKPADRFASAQEVADRLGRHIAELQRPGHLPTLQDVSPSAVEKVPPPREIPDTTPRIRRPNLRNGHRMGIAALLLISFGCLGFTEATGFTDFRDTVVRVFSPEGTLVVEVDDPEVSVKIDEAEIVITGAGAREIRLQPGRYTVEASKDGKLVRQELVTVNRKERQVVRVSREAPPSATMAARRSAEASAWERSLATMSVMEQVKAFVVRMKELNPGFDGKVEPSTEKGVVTGLAFNGEHVSDISPVRGFRHLRSFGIASDFRHKGPLMDLSPLKGLPLTSLRCNDLPVFDLSPLQGMPLTALNIEHLSVTDLTPLKGMPLRMLNACYTPVADLSPLTGMPLEKLVIHGTKATDLSPLKGLPLTILNCSWIGVSDLSPLKGMPLVSLSCAGNPASDLSPLKDMKLSFFQCNDSDVSDLSALKGMELTYLDCHVTKVSDLSPLKGMPLRRLSCDYSRVTDLSPVKGMPLTSLRIDFKAERDAMILRAIPTLETINDKPAAQFWKAVDARAEGR